MKDKTLKEVCDILRKYDMNWEISLSYFVASLFGVDRADMLSKDRSKDIVYARWFYWYVLREVCKKDYETIAQEVSIDDAIFVTSSIYQGISNMQELISSNSFYRDKWMIVKSMVSLKKPTWIFKCKVVVGYLPTISFSFDKIFSIFSSVNPKIAAKRLNSSMRDLGIILYMELIGFSLFMAFIAFKISFLFISFIFTTITVT